MKRAKKCDTKRDTKLKVVYFKGHRLVFDTERRTVVLWPFNPERNK